MSNQEPPAMPPESRASSREIVNPIPAPSRMPNVVPLPLRGSLASTRRRVPDERSQPHDDLAGPQAGLRDPAMMRAVPLFDTLPEPGAEPPLPDGEATDLLDRDQDDDAPPTL